MDWLAEGRRRALARLKSLEDSAPALSLPVHDTAESAPGWRFLGETFSCIPDPAYPWDPAVVRAIREFCPDVQPILIRSVWKSSRLDGEPKTMVLARHGIARAVRDPIAPVHQFDCHMPSTGSVGVRLSKPNYIEWVWYDRDVRPWGYDLPGAYLPFDWEFYHSLREAYVDSLLPEELSAKIVNPWLARKKKRSEENADRQAYINADLSAYHQKKLDEASDLELEEFALQGGALTPPPKPSIVVP